MNPCSQTVNEGEVGLTNLVYNDDGSASIDVVLPAMTGFNKMHFDINGYDEDGTKPAVEWEGLGGISFDPNDPYPRMSGTSATIHDGIVQGDWMGGPALRLTFGDLFDPDMDGVPATTKERADEFIKAIFRTSQAGIMAGHTDYGEQYIQSYANGWQSLVLLEYMSSSSCAGYIEVPNYRLLAEYDRGVDASFFFAATSDPAAASTGTAGAF